MRERSLGALIFFALTATLPGYAQTTINFDALSDGASVTTQYSGLTFSNAQALTAGFSLNDIDFPPHSGANAITDTAGPISIVFSTAISAFSGYFTHVNPITVTALDGNGNQLAATTSTKNNAAVSGNGSPNELLSLTGTGIVKVVITGSAGGNSLVADDVSYTTPAASGGGGGGGGTPPGGGNALTVSPTSVTISANAGGAPGSTAVTLSYQTQTQGAPAFSSSSNTNQGLGWLSVSPASGTLTQASYAGFIYTYTATVNINGDPTGIAAGTTDTGTVNFSSGGGIVSVPVTLNVTAPTPPTQPLPQPTGGIANAASGGQATPSVVSPGSYVAIYGTLLAGNGNPSATSLPLPTTLNGAQVTLCGVPMPLLYASASQINALIPQGLTSTTCPLIVITGTTQSAPVQLTVTELQPGIYTLNESGSGPGIVTEALTGQLNSVSNPAHAGDYLVLYCTGLGSVQSQSGQAGPAVGSQAPSTTIFYTTATVTATIGGVSSTVQFSGLTPTFAGLYQVNVQVPAGVIPGNAVPVVITSTDPTTGTTAQSNKVTIVVQ